LKIRVKRGEKSLDVEVTLRAVESPLPGSMNRRQNNEEAQP
jgi:hypothetical protein